MKANKIIVLMVVSVIMIILCSCTSKQQDGAQNLGENQSIQNTQNSKNIQNIRDNKNTQDKKNNKNNYNIQSNQNKQTQFGIYLYDTVETSIKDVSKEELRKEPAISEKNIKSYNWKTHEILIVGKINIDNDFQKQPNNDSQNQLDERLKVGGEETGIPLKHIDVSIEGGCKTVGGRPNGRFAVLVNGVKKYEGVFPSAVYMSYQARGETVMKDTSEGVKIDLFGEGSKSDPRNQKNIYDVLKSLGKLIES